MRRPVLSAALVLALGPSLRAQDPPIPDDTEIVTTASGLRYSILEKGPGDAPPPEPNDQVTVHYTGWLTNGTEFDSSRARGEPSTFGVSQVIAGWTEGLQLMQPGDRFKFTIPGDLAYGTRGSPPRIPPDATLIFDVELLEVTRRPALPEFRAADPDTQKTTDSGLKYEVLTAGSGAQPAAEDIVDLRFAFWTPTGQLVQCTEQQGLTLKFPLDGLPPNNLAFLGEAARMMRVGDCLRLEVPPELGRGQASVWELELLGLSKPIPVPEFSVLDPDRTERTASGLEYEVIEAGSGQSPTATDTVTVHYVGWNTDGSTFDSSYSRGETTSFPLNRVIPGWTEGVQLMKPGAVYKFRIPPELAYGPQGVPPDIGPNATLIFQIELIKVN